MDLVTQIAIYLCIYFTAIIIYSIFISKNQSEEDFLMSSRARNWFSIWLSKYASSVWAAFFITYTAYIYKFWFWVFSLVFWFVISMFILGYYMGPKLHSISKKENFISIWDIVFFKTKSKFSKNTANIVSSLITFMFLLLTIVWWANIIAYFDVLSYEFSLVLILTIVTVYVSFIGFKWVITTDILQSCIIFLILMVISYYLFDKSDLTVLSNVEFEKLGIWTMLWFLVYWIFWVFSFIDRYQILFSWKNEKNIKKWFLFVMPLMLISVIALLMIWYFVRNEVVDLNPSLVFLKAIELYLPEVLVPFAIVMFFAAIMSSIDSYVYWIASHTNLFKIKDKVKNIRINTVLIVLIVLLIAYFFRDVIGITIFMAGFSLIISIPMLYLFWWKNFHKSEKKSEVFLLSLLFWLIGLIVGILSFWLTPVIFFFPLVFSFVWLFVFPLVSKIKKG